MDDSLKNFDPKITYPAYDGMTPVTPEDHHDTVFDIADLIENMTLRGARKDELSRAIRHSMVVMDAEKHNLNYKQSAVDNGISQLKRKYPRSTE